MRQKWVSWIFVLSIGGTLLAQPIEWVGSSSIDFGKVKEGEVLEGKFRFANKGKTPVHIREVHASCGCTTNQLSKMIYNPGETATISYSVKTKGFRGPIRKTIEVQFEEEHLEPLVYVIQATVISEIEVNPSFVDFKRLVVNPETTVTKEIRIRNNGEKPVHITEIKNPCTLLSVKMEKSAILPGEEIVILLSLRPGREETNNVDLWIETNHPSRSRIMIPVFFRIQGEK